MDSSAIRLVCGGYNDVSSGSPFKKGRALALSSAVLREPSSNSIVRDFLSCRETLHSMLYLYQCGLYPMTDHDGDYTCLTTLVHSRTTLIGHFSSRTPHRGHQHCHWTSIVALLFHRPNLVFLLCCFTVVHPKGTS